MFLIFTKFHILRKRTQNNFCWVIQKFGNIDFRSSCLRYFAWSYAGFDRRSASFAWVHEGRQAWLGYHIAQSYDPLANTRSLHAPSAVRMSILRVCFRHSPSVAACSPANPPRSFFSITNPYHLRCVLLHHTPARPVMHASFFGTSNSSSKIYRPRSWSYGPVNHFFETCACCCLPLRPHLRRVLQSNWFFYEFSPIWQPGQNLTNYYIHWFTEHYPAD